MMKHCISSKASMRSEHFLYFNNSRIQGEYLVPVKCIYALAAVRSKAVILLLLTFCSLLFP